MTNKEIKQLKEMKEKMFDCEHLTSEELKLFHELELKRNKQYIHFRLSGVSKYYHGNICYEFRNIILHNGIENIKAEQIKDVNFGNNYTIAIRYNNDNLVPLNSFDNCGLHIPFDTKKDLLGYVKGFIACYRNYNKNYYNEDLEKKTDEKWRNHLLAINKKDITL